MKNLNDTLTSQRRMGKIFLVIGLLGIVACILPWVSGISVADGGGAMVAFGCIFALIGLITAGSLRSRAKVLETMCAGDGILARWTYDSPQDQAIQGEFGEVVIGLTGIYESGELYTFNAFSCRLESVSLSEGSRPQILFTVSVPHKHGRHQKELRIPVPEGCNASAATVVQTLTQMRNPG